MPSDVKIFISHRFADKQIAEVIRKHLGIWGFDNSIYQASAPGLGPKAGDYITEEIKDALVQAKLVILVYTLPDYDWSFCMWECGLATHPKNPDTRTIVFQCNPHDVPKTFEGQRHIKVDKDDIKTFTIQCHRDDNFFPGDQAFRPDITDEVVETLSSAFLADLLAVIPPGQREERNRWDSLVLQLTRSDVDEIKQASKTEATERIRERSLVVNHFGEALKHFGFANFDQELTLNKLVDRWTGKTEGRANITGDWITELLAEIYRGLDNSPASPEWKTLHSVHYPGSCFYPVVNHVRVMPDGSMEFAVYLYRSQVV